MKGIVAAVVIVFAIATVIAVVRLWRDLGGGKSLFHWSPPRWEHEETPSGLAANGEGNPALPVIEKENSRP
jgi:hypothetical protein